MERQKRIGEGPEGHHTAHPQRTEVSCLPKTEWMVQSMPSGRRWSEQELASEQPPASCPYVYRVKRILDVKLQNGINCKGQEL